MRPVLILAVAALLAGCGGSGSPAKPELPGAPAGLEVQQRDLGGGWGAAWASAGTKAYAAALQDGKVVAGSAVKLRPLGPDQGERTGTIPQVAAELSAPKALVDYALLLDGEPLDVRGGGLTPEKISIYGAPAAPLDPGRHVVVAFARTDDAANAVAWTFTVR
jgi:hypothetical protein